MQRRDRLGLSPIEALSLWAGQSVGLVSDVRSAATIVREIVDEAESILQRLTQ